MNEPWHDTLETRLLPCPFCNSPAGLRDYKGIVCINAACGGEWWLEGTDAETLITGWNQRAATQEHEAGAAMRDAMRYRWLRDHARPTDPHMDGSFVWHISPVRLHYRARTIEEAVDTAMAEEATFGS